jgi:type II secretory pathway pseudopilin PulG
MKFYTTSSKGFTLIDILLAAAIVSLLSSLVLFQSGEAKKKAEDSQMQAEAQQVTRAVALYKNDHGGNPPPVGGPGQMNEMQNEMQFEGDPDSQYFQTMQILVDGGYLPEIPTSPNGRSYSYGVSADLKDAVFGVRLNKENSNTSTQNSCPVTFTNTTSMEVYTGCQASENCTESPGLKCYESNPFGQRNPLFTFCQCSSDGTIYTTPGIIESSTLCSSPVNYCQLVGNGPSFLLNSNGTRPAPYYTFKTIDSYSCSYTILSNIPEYPACNGTSYSDYCQCI